MNKGYIIWFTGLSGSGKTTIANSLKSKLDLNNYKTIILDADSIRSSLHKHLGFSKEDITNNNLGLAELALENSYKNNFVIVPIISPYIDVRERVREIIGKNFLEIYLKCSLGECVKRDTKGLYKRALNKEIDNLIGFTDSKVPYEEPISPDLILYTDKHDVELCTNKLYRYLITLSNL